MKVPLLGGAYEARSIIANAQRCVNLFPEVNPKDSPFPLTHYQTPGLDLCGTPGVAGIARGSYRASNGELYYCVGNKLYLIGSDCTLTLLGTLDTVAVGEVIGGAVTPGSSYYPPTWTDTYTSVPLTGGSGTGAIASITVALHTVSSVTITTPGSGYVVGDALTATLGGQIATGTITNAGSGYTDGSYFGESMTGGSGTDARAFITVAGGIVTAVSFSGSSQRKGVQFVALNVLSAVLDGIGTGFAYRVDTVASQGTGFAYTLTSVSAGTSTSRPVSMADNGLCLVLVDGSENGYVVDLTTHAFAKIGDPLFLGATKVDYVDTYFVFNLPGTRQWYISLSNITYASLTAGGIDGGTLTSGGAGYLPSGSDEIYYTVGLTGGSGTGAKATITVQSGAVTATAITSAGSGYAVSDALTAVLGGQIATATILNGGTGYTDGTFTAQPISGGGGHGARASITVVSGIVTTISFSIGGAQYDVGEFITWGDGVGSGFLARIATTAATSGSGFVFTVDSISSTGFDALDIASKTGFPDPIASVAVMHREIWLLGEQTTEVWYNTGATDFTFGIVPGVFIEHGCVAPYSAARQDLSLYWLSQDKQGARMVLKGEGYAAKRISTHAIENTFASYSDVSDAIGYTYQQGGHTFYVLTFPTADATWCYDAASGLWHQRASIDSDGVLHRHRGNCSAFAYESNFVGDYETGLLYTFNPDTYTDNGTTIPRIRSFPHLQNQDKRVSYRSFIADMEVGSSVGTTTDDPPQAWLRWSDDRGASWSNPILQSMGSSGQYRTSMQWNRLGMARDRVFELGWGADVKTALNGAYVEPMAMGS